MTREVWRIYWRAQRITVRETAKAFEDMVIHGRGFTKKGDYGEWCRDGSDVLRHVPLTEMYITEDRAR